MTFPPRIWEPIAWVLCLANVGGVWFAARPAEPWHATLHAGLAVLFGLWAERLAVRQHAVISGSDPQMVQRLAALERIELIVEATAIEVERISEANRFMSKLLAERGEAQSPESRPKRVITPL